MLENTVHAKLIRVWKVRDRAMGNKQMGIKEMGLEMVANCV